MRKDCLMRLIALSALAGLCLCPASANTAELNTDDFVAACSKDPIVTDDTGFDDGKVTPKDYCACIAAELVKNNLSQRDVDMLIKMHNEDISDADVESYPVLDDLMIANEGYEDHCRNALGLPADIGTDIEGLPEEDLMLRDDVMPEDGLPPKDDEDVPADYNGSPRP